MSLECLRVAPDYYKIILHIIGGLSVPINLTGIYLVMRHTPKNSSYKYCQLYVQLVTLFVELHMSWTCPGFYYFPLLGGINSNEFMMNYIPTHSSVIIYFFLFAFELPSILLCFIYRNESVSEMDVDMRIPKFVTYFILSSSHTFPFVLVLCILKAKLTDEQMKHSLAMYYPTCLHLLDVPGFIAYDWRINYFTIGVGICVVSYVCFFYSYALFLALRTIKILRKMRQHLSAATYKMHITAIVTLILQCVCPFVFVCMPLSIIIYVVVFDAVEYTALATNTMFFITAHSMMSTITMIACNTTYREWVTTMFFKLFCCHKLLANSILVEPSESVVKSTNHQGKPRRTI